MTNKNKHSRRHASVARRPMPIIIGLIIVAVITIILAKVLANHASETAEPAKPQSSNVTEEQNSTSDKKNTSTEESHTSSKEIPKYEGEDPNMSDDITGYVNYAGTSGQNYSIRVTINQYLTSGTCHLDFTGENISHTEDAVIIPSANSSTCEGFDIPLKALGQGTYIYNIYIESDGKTGNISGEVTL